MSPKLLLVILMIPVIAFGQERITHGLPPEIPELRRADYPHTPDMDTAESMKQIGAFPSRNDVLELTSTEGVTLKAKVLQVNLKEETADIYTDTRYTIPFSILDEESIEKLRDRGIKTALNQSLTVTSRTHNQFAPKGEEHPPFKLQLPPTGTIFTAGRVSSTNKFHGFQLFGNIPDVTVNVYLGVRVTRRIKRDASRNLDKDFVSGRYFMYKEYKDVELKGNVLNEFLSNQFITQHAARKFGGFAYQSGEYTEGYVEFEDIITAYFIIVTYKDEIVFAGIKNYGTIKKINEYLEKVRTGSYIPEFDIY